MEAPAKSARPPCRAEAAAQLNLLRDTAEALLNRWDLWIGGQRHCLVEIEAYVHGPTHQDPYTHGDEGQNCCGVWYFHRHGGSFKAGSFKGLDLACGDGARGVHAGLLIRSVAPLEGSPPALAAPVTEGPCLVVDRILALNGKKSIADFVAGRAAKELPAEAAQGHGWPVPQARGGSPDGDHLDCASRWPCVAG